MLNGYNIFWSKPLIRSRGNTVCIFNIAELLCLINSALSWKKFYGKINLLCDEHILRIFNKANILFLWDSVDVDILAQMSANILEQEYFSAAKLFVQGYLKTPYSIIDHDAYFIKSFNGLLKNEYDIIAAHRESLDVSSIKNRTKRIYTYPEPDVLYKNFSEINKNNFTYKQHPLNTAFLYISNDILRQQYINLAMEVIQNNSNITGNVNNVCDPYTCFIEQRLLAEIVHHNNYKAGYLTSDIFAGDDSKKERWFNPVTKSNHSFIYEVNNAPPMLIGSCYKHLWFDKHEIVKNQKLKINTVKHLLTDLVKILGSKELSIELLAKIEHHEIETTKIILNEI